MILQYRVEWKNIFNEWMEYPTVFVFRKRAIKKICQKAAIKNCARKWRVRDLKTDKIIFLCCRPVTYYNHSD